MLSKVVINGLSLLEARPLELGNITCVIGRNATGKTLLLDLIASLFNQRLSRRLDWLKTNNDLDVTAVFADAGSQNIYRRQMFNGGRDLAWLNGSRFSGDAETAVHHKVLNCEVDYSHSRDWMSKLARQLSADTLLGEPHEILRQVMERHGSRVQFGDGHVAISAHDEVMWVTKEPQLESPLTAVSGGERISAALQLAMGVGLELALACPTILLLDDVFALASETQMRALADTLVNISSPNLQIVVTTSHSRIAELLHPDSTIWLTPRFTANWPGSTRQPVAINAESEPLAVQTHRRQPHAVSSLKNAIESYQEGSEDAFIDNVLNPGLLAIGCKGVSRISNHGPGEFGVDVGPFTADGPFGRHMMVGLQAKAGVLSAASGRAARSVETLVAEVRKALDHRFLDRGTNTRRRLDYVIAAVSGRLTMEAKERFYDAFEGDQRVILWEAQDMAELFWKERVTILPYERE